MPLHLYALFLLLQPCPSESGFLFSSAPAPAPGPDTFKFSEAFSGTWRLERQDQIMGIGEEVAEEAVSAGVGSDDGEDEEVLRALATKSLSRYVIVPDNITNALVGTFYDDDDVANNHLVRIEFDEDGNGGNKGRFYTAGITGSEDEDEDEDEADGDGDGDGGEMAVEYLLEAPEDGAPLFHFDFSPPNPSDLSHPSTAAVSMGRWNGNNVGWYTFVFTSPSSFVLNVVPVNGGRGSAFVILGTRVASGNDQARVPPPWYVRFGPSLAISAVFMLRRFVGEQPRQQQSSSTGEASKSE
jgi:hypothetical protein